MRKRPPIPQVRRPIQILEDTIDVLNQDAKTLGTPGITPLGLRGIKTSVYFRINIQGGLKDAA